MDGWPRTRASAVSAERRVPYASVPELFDETQTSAQFFISNTLVSSSRKRKVIGVEALRLYMKHSLELHIP